MKQSAKKHRNNNDKAKENNTEDINSNNIYPLRAYDDCTAKIMVKLKKKNHMLGERKYVIQNTQSVHYLNI